MGEPETERRGREPRRLRDGRGDRSKTRGVFSTLYVLSNLALLAKSIPHLGVLGGSDLKRTKAERV